MSKVIIQEMVQNLFTTMPLSNGDTRVIYAEQFIKANAETVEHDLYELVSTIAHKSGLSFDFSYEVISRACNVVADLPIWNGDDMPDEDDGVHEAIDNIIPVYNHELLKIANPNDYHLVDEALENGASDLINACQMAYYDAVYSAVREIVLAIEEYNNANA